MMPAKDEFFEKNLDVVKKIAPWLFDKLCKIDEPHSRLIEDEDDGLDIEFQGTRLYGKSHKRYVEDQVAAYWKKPHRVNFSPPQSVSLDRVAGRFTYNVMRRAVDAGMAFSPIPLGRECFYLMIFGFGLGAHVVPLVEETKCRGLILVEPNVEFLYHSLFTFDWEDLFQRFSGEGKFISIIRGDNHDEIAYNIRQFIRSKNPSFLDGALIFSHYKGSVLEMAQKRFQADASLVLSGLGFFDDDIKMIRNSFENLKNYTSYIYRRVSKPRSLPVFIIGCGPSLDQSFEVIRQNRDKAILLSCGTTLGVLLANGIVPDYQLEIENVEPVYAILSDKAANYDISGITLVASSTVDPRVRPLFSKTIFFFRQVLASWSIFSLGADTALFEAGPTVTNAGLSFAQDLGFREFYFFGMDYGTRDREQHHAKDSEYRPGGKVKFSQGFNMVRPGNLGGSVHTNGIYIWARDTVERNIRNFRRGATYYNCSNGMAIDGTIPKIPKAVSLPGGVDKAVELDNLLGDLIQYDRAQFEKSWGAKDWAGAVGQLCDELIGLCDDRDGDYPFLYLLKMFDVLTAVSDMDLPSNISLLRGSIFMMLITVGFYPSRLTDPTKAEELQEIIRSEVRARIEEMRTEALDFFRGLEP